MTDSEKGRKIQKFVESLEAFQLLCKQLDHQTGELLKTLREETKDEI